jgi:ribosomal protein S18 acetylase RimI-like enzyme
MANDELDPGVLETDAVTVRTLKPEDLSSIVLIDQHITGRGRRPFYESKIKAAVEESGVRISLVAELDGVVAGFLMGNVHYGEFGATEPVAVLDTLGVDPGFRGQHVGQALMRQYLVNLRGLGVERVETQVDWEQGDLLSFLKNNGFAPAPRLCLALELA